MALKPEINI